MDALKLEYTDSYFDIVIDKSNRWSWNIGDDIHNLGTIDAILCGVDSYLNLAKMIKVNIH